MEQHKENSNSLGSGVNTIPTDLIPNADTNVTQQPLPNVPTQEVEYGGGQTSDGRSITEYPMVKELTFIENQGPTLQLTDISEAKTFTRDGSFGLLGQKQALSPSSNGNTLLDPGNMAASLTDKTPVPTAFVRGTLFLSPFGLTAYMGYTGTPGRAVTAFGALTALDGVYARATGTLESNLTLVEVNNYKSFSEMKDAIISYRSRSIAFTNLDTIDMLLLEGAREARLGKAALALFAGLAAREYMRDATEKGIPFSTELTRNLTNPEVLNKEYQLYAAIANQKTFDNTFWKRLGVLTKLHVSSARNGVAPTIIAHDVDINIMNAYKPSGKVGVYNVSVPNVQATLNSITDATGTSGHPSFQGWLTLYLGGSEALGALLAAYESAISLVNDTINSMKIITGAIDTIEANRGAKFNTIASFLPINGVHCDNNSGNAFLDYAVGKPVFSYFYKEKVEHAPQSMFGESASGGNNFQYNFNLSNLPYLHINIPPRIAPTLSMRRPAGLYKGEEAWKIDELLFIGIFRPVEFSSVIAAGFVANAIGSDSILAAGNKVAAPFRRFVAGDYTVDNFGYSFGTFTDGSAAISAGANASAQPIGLFSDRVYGDMYFDAVSIYSLSNASAAGVRYLRREAYKQGDYIRLSGTYYQSGAAQSVMLNPGSGWLVPPTTSSGNTTLIGGSMANTCAVSLEATWEGDDDAESTYDQLQGIATLYAQMDITAGPLVPRASIAGTVEVPRKYYTPYRGAQWYEFSLVTVKAIIISMSQAFSMTYKNNAQVRASAHDNKTGSPNPQVNVK